MRYEMLQALLRTMLNRSILNCLVLIALFGGSLVSKS